MAWILAGRSRHPADLRASLVLPVNHDDWLPPTPTILVERRQRDGTQQSKPDDFCEHLDTNQRLNFEYTS